ncbi:phage tail protein I [Sansalvadorimonas verongulae]|uniref:phage tail protein I n=1 Tax=Sansalvadorimonas verongulae TaxID=2172824 RepID=UPI0012BCBFEC|nr:phage tail protein I [Sansalvadorimonas verongulae]MTI12629.1 phage tail protein I [Sansalvadorimonas verongulae]
MDNQHSLLPVNATEFERQLEQIAADQLALAEFDPRTLWNPHTCPVELLPWLAWSFSVDSWEPTWPEHIRRSIIANAIDVQSRKGTVFAVEEAVGAFGVESYVTEYQDAPDRLAPFEFEALLLGSTHEIQQGVMDAINTAKRANTYFKVVNGVTGTSTLGMIGIGRTLNFQRFNCPAS